MHVDLFLATKLQETIQKTIKVPSQELKQATKEFLKETMQNSTTRRTTSLDTSTRPLCNPIETITFTNWCSSLRDSKVWSLSRGAGVVVVVATAIVGAPPPPVGAVPLFITAFSVSILYFTAIFSGSLLLLLPLSLTTSTRLLLLSFDSTKSKELKNTASFANPTLSLINYKKLHDEDEDEEEVQRGKTPTGNRKHNNYSNLRFQRPKYTQKTCNKSTKENASQTEPEKHAKGSRHTNNLTKNRAPRRIVATRIWQKNKAPKRNLERTAIPLPRKETALILNPK